MKKYCPNIDVVAKCGSGKAGLEAIEKTKPDVVFLDIELPNMNGFEVLEKFTQIPFSVIFTTGYDQYAIKAIRFSALDYLLKPIDPKELIAAVNNIQTQKYLPAGEQYEILLNRIQNKDCVFRKIAFPTAEGYELLSVEYILRCEADKYLHPYTFKK